MANNPAEQFEKKILVALESTMSGVQDTLRALEAMKKRLGEVASSTKYVNKAYKSVSKTLDSSRKSLRDYNRSLKITKRFQRGLYESMRGIGSVARTTFGAATAAATAFLIETKRIGDTMLQFQTSSLQAATAVNRLRASYKALGAEAGTAVLSLQDIASQLTEFQRQGIAEMAVGAQESFIQGFAGFSSALARTFGKGGARDLMSDLTQSMGVEFKKFRISMGGELKELTTEFEAARKAGAGSLTDPRSAQILGDLVTGMEKLRLYTGDQAAVMQRVIASFQTMKNVFEGGGEPLTRAVISLNEAWATFGTTIETLSTEFVAAFGPHLAKLIDTIGERINKAIGKGAKSAAEYVADLSKRFEDWGGVPELVKRIENKLAAMYRTLKPVIDYLASVARRFIEADAKTKIFAASVAAIAFAPGLAIGLTELVRGFKGLATWAAQAATASAAIGGKLGGLGAGAAGALRFGIAGGAGLAAGGAAQMGARAVLGTEKGGLADRGIGAGTAALVGLSFGGPWGAAVAGVSKVLWDSYSTIKSDHEATKKLRVQHEDLVKQGKSMTADFKRKLEESKTFAATRAQRAKIEEGELILRKFKLAPDADFSEIERKIREAHQKSLGLDPIEFEIASSYQVKIEDLKKRYKEAVKAGDFTKGTKNLDEQIKSLQEAGRLESKRLHILRQIEEVEAGFATGRIDDIAHSKNMTRFQKSLEKVEEKQIEAEIGIDPRPAIANIKKRLQKISEAQDKINIGMDIDLKKFKEQKGKALAAYDSLKKKFGESVPGGQFEKAIASLDKLQNKIIETRDLAGFELLLSQIRDLTEYTDRTLPGFTSALAGIVSIIDSLGPASRIFGDSIDAIASTGAIDAMQESFQSMANSALAVRTALDLIAEAKTNKELEEAERLWVDGVARGIKASADAAALLKATLDANLKSLQKNVELVQLAKGIRQADLDISQQLYGTPALAVQAQLALVKTMQAEKELLEAQLAATERQHASAKLMLGTNEDIFMFKQKELELTQSIKQLTADQLRQVKQLRDGYLDAVVAQSLGAQRFSKILITQDQNLMRGLQKQAVKRNYLLGQYGEEAAKSQADPYRFSAQGMGFLETLGGQTMRPEDIAKAVYDRVANISDPLSKASALQSADIWMNIMSGADKNTKDLGSIFMLGQDRVVDAINALAEQRLPRSAAGLALKDVPAGITAKGAAFDRWSRGLATPPLDAASYREQAEKQGSALASIEALLSSREGNPGVPGAPGRQIKPDLANLFFRQSLQHHKSVEALLLSIARALGAEARPVNLPMSTLQVRGGTSLSSSVLNDLKRTDKQVKKHEQAHKRAAGPYALGPPKYTYKRGPDGRRYATGGEVLVDLSPITGNPQATAKKMQRIRKAALAPRHPSRQDIAVAKSASLIESKFKRAMGTGVPAIWIPTEPGQLAAGDSAVGSLPSVPLIGPSSPAVPVGPSSISVPHIDPVKDINNMARQYRQLIEQLNTLGEKISDTEFGDKFDSLSKDFDKTRSELERHITKVISSFETESIQAVSDLSKQLVQPYLGQMVNELNKLGDTTLRLSAVPEIEKGDLEKEFEGIQHRVSMQADVIRSIFGETGSRVLDEVLEEYSQGMTKKAAEQITAYQGEIAAIIDAGAKVPTSIFDKIEQIRMDFDPKLIDPIVAESSKNLGEKYTNQLASQLQRIGDLQLKLDTASPDQAKELQEQLDNTSNSLSIQADKIRAIFGSRGLDMISKSLSEFSDNMANKAISQIAEYETGITKLEQVGDDLTPNMKFRVESQISELRQKIENIKFDFGAKDIASAVARIDDSGIDKKLGVLDNLQRTLAMDVDFSDMNLNEVIAVRESAEQTLAFFEKQYKQLAKNKKITTEQVIAFEAARVMVDQVRKHEQDRERQSKDFETRRTAILGKQQILAKQMANIKLPLAEADKLRKIEEQRAQGIKFSSQELAKEIPQVAEISDLWKKATKRDRGKVPEQREGQTKEEYRESKRQFRDKREKEGLLAAEDIKDMLGEDWHKIGANINNMLRAAVGEGTKTPGQLSRGIERLNKSLASKKGESAQLEKQRENIQAADAFAGMSASMKEMVRTSAEGLSPGMAGLAGGLGGAAGALFSGDRDLSSIFGKAKGGAQQASIIQGALGPQPDRKTEEMLRSFGLSSGDGVPGTMYRRRGTGGGTHPALGGIPTLTAVDTDEYMGRGGRRDPSQALREKYGRRADPMLRSMSKISGIDEKIQQEGSAKRRKVLEGVRTKQIERLKKMHAAAEKAGPRQTQAEREQLANQARQQQAAAQQAMGLGYTGKAPKRVPVGPQGPDTVRGRRAPISSYKTGVPEPTRVRQLTHGSGGNFATKGKGVKQILQQAGQIIEEMGREMDSFNEGQDNITQYAGNRLFNVQAISP